MPAPACCRARAELGIAYGELFPHSQSIGGSRISRRVSKNLQFVSDVERVADLDLNFVDYQVGFDAAWELDVWGGQRRGVQSAAANLAAQVANYDDAPGTLTGDVAAVYINIRALQEALAVTRRNIDGVKTELDVQEATALLNDTRALVPPLEAELAQAKNALGVLLAQPPSSLNARLGSGRIPASRAIVGVGVPAETPPPPAGHPRRRDGGGGTVNADRRRDQRAVPPVRPVR